MKLGGGGKGLSVDPSGEQGVAMIMALIAVLVLTALGLALTSLGILDVKITTNVRESTEALYIAEAGITHAKGIILSRGGKNFDSYLQGGNGTACDGDELSDNALFTIPLSPADAITSAASGGHSFGSGRYEVSVCDDHDVESNTTDPPDLPDTNKNHDANGRIHIISTGFGPNGATATVEVIMATATLPAIVVGGDLRINGNPKVFGSAGAVHSNDNLEVSGNPCIEQYISANGSITGGGSTGTGCDTPPYIGSDSPPDKRPAQELITIPTLQPGNFSGDADYLLKADGSVVRTSDGFVLKPPGAGNWGKWDVDTSKPEWNLTGDPVPAGTYYSEGSITVSGNPGSPGSPLSLTLIAEGWINISGNPEMAPALTSGGSSYAMIAGQDLKIAGNPANAYKGIFYAGDQIGFSGNPELVGQVIAANEADVGFPNPGDTNPVPLSSGVMEISGNPTITYDETVAITNLNVDGWRECRGSDPWNPCGLPP
ncbi:pilus assembly PilX N-terminal domain-containing protein [Acidobacteria bacterium AH-259-L09]|nr:pilus assembly PilX N-terminal domain-containing protein [Acidobacteria bacterium AH-259-L09]